MADIIYETPSAVFRFDDADTISILEYYAREYHIEEAIELLTVISPPMGEVVNVSNEFVYFSYIALEMIRDELGSVHCKECERGYPCNELLPVTNVKGKTTGVSKIKKRARLKKLSGKREIMRITPGDGFACPREHLLLAL
jgi:hypothetical protein